MVGMMRFSLLRVRAHKRNRANVGRFEQREARRIKRSACTILPLVPLSCEHCRLNICDGRPQSKLAVSIRQFEESPRCSDARMARKDVRGEACISLKAELLMLSGDIKTDPSYTLDEEGCCGIVRTQLGTALGSPGNAAGSLHIQYTTCAVANETGSFSARTLERQFAQHRINRG